MAVLVAALVAFPLAGCASGSPTSMPNRTSTTTVTPTPTADPVASAPAQVFGGDCDAVLTSAEAGDAFGTSMSMWVRTAGVPRATPQDFAVSQLGGLECSWVADNQETRAELHVFVLPATFMEPTDTTVPYCYGTDSGTEGTGSCSFNVDGSGFWLSGVAYTPLGTTNDDALAAIETLRAQLTLNAAAAPLFVAASAAPGSWTDKARAHCMAQLTPEEIRTGDIGACACETVANSEHVAAALADTGITVASGNAPGELPHGFYRALGAAGTLGCLWSEDAPTGREFEFGTDILPGGAWVQTQLAALPGVTEVSIEGVDRALLSSSAPGLAPGHGLDIFDGPNWLHLSMTSVWGPESYGPLAAALVAALNDAR
ncbi:hypothetical protein [Cryobacterium tagatosivorans]|uniref:DUF3558 domain-containing protein n=1 Tax=Cryobacterium tagatosivorans TaxID=1259199 RepID=A0A4R8UG13_9MICO|nr:hypothetical protein [Cryobacterium tagatosivorans]TFB51256.1 hypothetical protein E3O23_08860 [Cryobacterium tagatosivorans]